MIRAGAYRVADPDALETPAMLLFQDLLEHNIRSVCDIGGGAENLVVHVKTHKSAAVVRRQIEHGIASFKCATLQELEMVLEAGAKRAILAYPQVQPRKIGRFCDLAKRFPAAWVAVVVSCRPHVERLAAAASDRRQSLRVMLDLDAGMHRTGINFGPDALQLYRAIDEHTYLAASGLHLYDGHEHWKEASRRQAAATKHIESLANFRERIEALGMAVPLIVAGGTYSFPYYAKTEGMLGSPGTIVYWDAGSRAGMPELPFRCAALVLTQVVDRYPHEGRVTTDLGSKGISSDLPLAERAALVGHDSAQLVLQSEEHGVFSIDGELPQVGDYLLAIPGHVCPTTIRYPGIHVIDPEGRAVDYYTHTARDRE